jgi:hypothetical protein
MKNSFIGTYFYIPGNFDLDKLIEEYPIDNSKFKDGFEKLDMLYILSQLIEVSYLNGKHKEDRGYVRLKAKYIQKVVPSYKDYLNYLTAANVLDIDNHYQVGKKSRGYAFYPPYIYSDELKEIPVPITSRLYKRIAEQDKEIKIREIVKTKYPYLAVWLNNHLTIDLDSANKLISLIHRLHEKERERFRFYVLNAPGFLTHKEETKFLKLGSPIYEYKFGLLTIRKQRWFAVIDATVNRLHTNITNLKSELRSCLRYNNEDLVCIDIKNSQPYLSILLLNAAFYEPEANWEKFYKRGRGKGYGELYPITPIYSNPSITLSSFPSIYSSLYNSSPLTILLSEIVSDNDKNTFENDKLADINLYIKYASSGTLYEYIEDAMIKKGLPVPNSRQELKAIVFQSLFTDNRFIQHPEAAPKRIFEELFPTVSQVFKHIKRKESNLLPILLQQLESTLFLDHIAKRISQEQPGLPIFTIHDSIMTLKSKEEYVKSIIMEECQKVIGVAPAVSIEYYDDRGIQNKIKELQKAIAPIS